MSEMEKYGFKRYLEKIAELPAMDISVGRVLSVHRDSFRVITEGGEIEAEPVGRLRLSSREEDSWPVVGDFVEIRAAAAEYGVILNVLPRFAQLKRRKSGSESESQPMAANVDTAYIVEAVGQQFSMNRIERFHAMCRAGHVEPVVIISKSDLIAESETASLSATLADRLGDIETHMISIMNRESIQELGERMSSGRTFCLLGLSGAGKSTLLNALAAKDVMATGELSSQTGKGRHTTTHRELFRLDSGALIVDNPGIRELGMIDVFQDSFQPFLEGLEPCRYTDCHHVNEPGCAVLEAIAEGRITPEAYENWLKLSRESARAQKAIHERRRDERRFSRMVKNYKKNSDI